jgi:hypothetical protein
MVQRKGSFALDISAYGQSWFSATIRPRRQTAIQKSGLSAIGIVASLSE